MGMVLSEEKAKSGIARKGDRRCCSGCVLFLGVGFDYRCEGCSEQSERREIFSLVRRDARVCCEKILWIE